MGSLFSKSNSSDERYEQLRLELDNLFARLDTNNDNVVTQDELVGWTEQHKRDLDELKDQKQTLEQELKSIQESFRENLATKELRIQQLESELSMERLLKDNLEKQNRSLIKMMDEDDDLGFHSPIAQSVISSTLISEYVDEILKNENINIDYLPDSVEKAIYKNVLRLILHLIDEVGEKTTLDLFGHKLRVIVTQS